MPPLPKPRPLVVIPCGGRKRTERSPAGELYTGPYFLACLRWALARTYRHRVLILSAKHGLVGLEEELDPYDVRMGDRGCVTEREVLAQASARGLLFEQVVALGGRGYTSVCRTVWPDCETPLDGVGGIGKQLKWLKEH